MVLLRPDDLARLLEGSRLAIRVHGSRPLVAVIVDLGVVVEGETENEVVDHLVAELRLRAARAVEHSIELLDAGQAAEAAALLRFALTDPDAQSELVRCDIAATGVDETPRRLAMTASWSGAGDSIADVPEDDLLEGFGA
jgi:hypothetical protein